MIEYDEPPSVAGGSGAEIVTDPELPGGLRGDSEEGTDHNAQVALKGARGLRVELDYLLPEGDRGVEPRVVEWFTAAVAGPAGGFMTQIPPGGLPAGRLRDREGEPLGEPGSAWCSLLVISQGKRRLPTSLRAWSPKNWENFLSKAPELSIEMSAKFSTLNGAGHPGTPSLTVSAYRPRAKDGRQWLLLDATYVVGRLGRPTHFPTASRRRGWSS